MRLYTYADYSQPNFVDNMIINKQDFNKCTVEVYPNTRVNMPARLFLLNVIFWEPLMKFNIVPTLKEVYRFKYLTNTAISKIHTELYEVYLATYPDSDHMEFVRELFNNIGRLYNFIKLRCGKHMPSTDQLGMVQLMSHPELKKLSDTYLDPKEGTEIAEIRMKEIAKELSGLLGDPNIENNMLYPYMKAGILKSNQVPQMLVAYGTRADIDDTMMRHIVSNSTFSGLQSVEDYAIEYLSAKKASYANSSSIKQSQYHGRKLKLLTSIFPKLYKGTCGSEMTLDYRILPEHRHNYIEKIIVEDGKYNLLTKQNIDKYVDKSIKLVSPFGCRYIDGVCERCAGYGRGRLLKYMPPNIHIGLFVASILASIISQKILSTRHLISTTSKLLNLPDETGKIFFVSEDTIKWRKHLYKDLKKITVRIPIDAVSMAEDIELDVLPIAENFSKLAYMEIYMKGQLRDTVVLGDGTSLPYLSENILKYMKEFPDNTVIAQEYIDINMKDFDIREPFAKYIILNDDMLSYHSRVSNFMNTKIKQHTTVAGALTEFAATVYDKSSMDFFNLEMVLRAFNIVGPDNYVVPVVTDMNNVHFDGMSHIITNSTISMKLSFERLGDYITTPSTVLYPKPAGLYAPFYGLY